MDSQKKIRVFETHLASDIKLQEQKELSFYEDKAEPAGREDRLLNIYDGVKYQEILGFGGAFTEATTMNLKCMNPELKKRAMEMYFDREKGIGYNFCRSTINSCDFSEDFYTYDDVDGDFELKHFDISHDKEPIIPTIREAMDMGEDVILYSSPWSPPAWMKTNEKMSKGGKLKKDCYQVWADYVAKFIKEYEAAGVPVWGVTVQNEAKAEQGWESCFYTAEEERAYVVENLKPAMKRNQLADKKIMFWDHNKERVVDRACVTMGDDVARDCLDGVAVHWYSGDHFGALDVFHGLFPEKLIIASEQCTGKGKTVYASGEKYAHDIIGDLNNWANAWVDWNMVLDENGNPDHWKDEQQATGVPEEKIWVGESPIVYDREKKALDIRSSYYYMGHFSKFIRRGAKRIGYSVYDSTLEACAFENPDGTIVCVVLNRTDDEKELALRYQGQLADVQMKAHSIYTFVF
jgi:glucosylceramidase